MTALNRTIMQIVGIMHGSLGHGGGQNKISIFSKKVDTVKRKVSVSVFHNQPGKDTQVLSAFSAGYRRPQYIQRWNARYPDDLHIVDDKPSWFFMIPKNDSATALSQHSPLRDMLWINSCLLSSLRKSLHAYWTPRSE